MSGPLKFACWSSYNWWAVGTRPRCQRNGGSHGTFILIVFSGWNPGDWSGGKRPRAGHAAGNAWVRTWRWDWRWNRGYDWSGTAEPTHRAGDRQMAAKYTAAEYSASRRAGRTSANQPWAESLRGRCVSIGRALRFRCSRTISTDTIKTS